MGGVTTPLTYLLPMDTISYFDLVAWLQEHKGLAIVGLHCLTDARCRKTGNPYGQVTKRVQTVGFVGADYELAVNREALRQPGATPEFQATSLPWGKWLIPHKVIEHNGKLYLRTQTTPGNRRKQPAKVLAYYASNGHKLTRDDVRPYLPVVRESDKQQSETGIRDTVWVRTYAFESIKRIRLDGRTYLVKP